MIIFYSYGRLGNQIFQFMFLKKISKPNEHILCFNMSMFFELFDFDKTGVWHILNKYYLYTIIRRIFIPVLILPLCRARIINYISQKKDERNCPLPDWEEKKGLMSFIRYVNKDYFQSEILFDDSTIKKIKMCIKEKPVSEAKKIISEIPDNYTKVFIHVRRGDYLDYIHMGNKGVDLPRSYYTNAINIVKKNITNPFFIILSDDTNYVKCCFKEINPKIIPESSMEVDFAIMTMCTAGILSNSSFSWWGAYLMTEKKLVISPKYWFGWKQKRESHLGIQPSFSIVIDPELG